MSGTRRSNERLVFDLSQPKLSSVLADVQASRIRLPYFHRDWCWSDERVRSLLESIGEGHPIGSLMFLNAVPLHHRSLDGVMTPSGADVVPTSLVLDGQQRLTAIFQACYKPEPVKIMSGARPEYRLYYFDMRQAISPDLRLQNAIIPIVTDPDGAPLRDGDRAYIDPIFQYERGIFPFNRMFDFDSYDREYCEFWYERAGGAVRSEALQCVKDFRAFIVAAFEMYRVPVEVLRQPADIRTLCRVYEKLNSSAAS